MKLTFRLTYDDHLEALATHAIVLDMPAVGRRERLPARGLGVLSADDLARRPPSRAWNLLAWLVVAGALVVAFTVFGAGRADPRPEPEAPARRTSLLDAAAYAFPFVLMLTVFLVAFFGGRRRRQAQRPLTREAFDADPALAQELSVVVEEWGLRASAADWQHDTEWSTFQRAIETPSLFLLYDRSAASVLLPKRAFASEADVSAFRALLVEALGTSAGRGFPVTRG